MDDVKRILMVGDIVGNPGRKIVKTNLERLKAELKLDAVIVNGENSAAGSGITAALANELTSAGADAITLGDHTWGQKEFAAEIDSVANLVRPGNFPKECHGKGWRIITLPTWSFIVANIQGRIFMQGADCPFHTFEKMLAEMPKNLPIFVDIHAEATSEKITFAHYFDGKVTAIAGTHTHVQTSDAQILPNGTAFITDLGMCGPYISSIGRDLKPVTKRFITGMPARFEVATGPSTLEGAIITFSPSSPHKACSIEPFRLKEPLP